MGGDGLWNAIILGSSYSNEVLFSGYGAVKVISLLDTSGKAHL